MPSSNADTGMQIRGIGHRDNAAWQMEHLTPRFGVA